jgi:NAD(P)-dependent dehydrogenase (short-subunit alcohol dehydrogenase family)
MDLRDKTGNELIYAEQVDLSSLQSIRLFATKWVDNAPPRRLDQIILCGATSTPPYTKRETTVDGLEANWGVNYVANFHLLSILNPAIKAQPPDRDVRIIVTTCGSYMAADLDVKDSQYQRRKYSPGKAYAASKMALMVFARTFQRHLDSYERPDKQPQNARVIIVDPGFSRTPGMRRWLTAGSLWGLLIYIFMWPLWWLILKNTEQGAQGILKASFEAELGRAQGGRFLRECQEIESRKKEMNNEELAKELWQLTEKQIEALEKEGAVKRAKLKKEIALEEANAKAAAEKDEAKAEKKPGSRRSRKAE